MIRIQNSRLWATQIFKIYVALTLTLMTAVATAQVKGVITEAGTGEPLIGASVLVKGTAIGTVTGLEGDFTLDAKAGDILKIS